jgi:hypothetical protein
MGKSVLQDWVMELGLRHQGVLVSIVRGCDSEPRNSPTKALVRCLREVILNCHCGDAAKAATFIERVDDDELERRMVAVRKNLDHLPHHFVMHLIHAVEIVGYKHPSWKVRVLWLPFYTQLVAGLHLTIESEAELDARLNATEEEFAQMAVATHGS